MESRCPILLNRGCLIGLVSGWIGLADALPAGVRPELAEVWDLVADHQPQEAQAALRQMAGSGTREQVLAGVVLVLARPPVAEARLPELDALLAGLAGGEDDVAAEAWYLRARLWQVHAARPDYVRAGESFLELARRWPGSHWAQLGLVKLGLIRLFAPPDPADPEVRLAGAAELLGGITEPALRRDLHLQIGWAGLFYERPLEEILPHLLAADRVGGLMGITAEDLVLQIGELSLRAGRHGQARAYFERFLREYPTTIRRYNVQQRLAELEALPAKAPEGGS